MSARIRISYERPEELEEILERLAPIVRSYKVPKEQKGRYRKAYADLYTGLGALADLSFSEFMETYGQKPRIRKPQKT